MLRAGYGNLNMDPASLSFPFLSRPGIARLAGALRLRGPLSKEPTARVLHALLLGISVWAAFYLVVILPFFTVRKGGNLIALGGVALASASALHLLNRGSLRRSAIVYVLSSWVVYTVVIVLQGGIRSPLLIFYMALPISAAWLFGYRGTLWMAAGCAVSTLLLALMETAGFGPYVYFPGTPFALWATAVLAIVMAAVPVARVMKTLQDALAESKLAQEALRSDRDLMARVMETSPAGILAVSRDGKINFANARAASLLGMTPDAICRSYLDSAEWKTTSHDGSPLPAYQTPLLEALAHREAVDGMQVAIRPGDSRILLSVNAARLVNAAGEFDGAVISVEDVTERRRVEDELHHHQENLQELVDQRTAELVSALDQAQSANRAKTLFLANMSHELRTPLHAILGFSNLMRREQGLAARHTETLDIISRSGSQLLALIDDILDMARIEAGHGGLAITRVDLTEVVRDVMNLMRGPAMQKSLELSTEWSGAKVHLVRTDGPKLRQVLVNLVGNAITYTDAGSVILRVNIEEADHPGKLRLRVEVQDTGIGIAPEAQESVFDPFVQLGQPNSRKGTGLGLAICRQFAQIMGGTMQVESALGKGSKFRVELPAEAAGESQAGALQEGESIVAIAPNQREFRVLVIEDDLASRLLLERLLEGAGFKVRTAPDGESGIRVFSVWHPHFIWLDIRLPGMNGLEVTRKIRTLAHGEDVKIAALTASAFNDERDAVLAAGVDDFVRKPFQAETVFACMGKLLGVQYARSTTVTQPFTDPSRHGLAEIAALPKELKTQLLHAVLLLDKDRILEVIRSVSALDPALASELTRHAEALEFTPIMRAIQSGEAA